MIPSKLLTGEWSWKIREHCLVHGIDGSQDLAVWNSMHSEISLVSVVGMPVGSLRSPLSTGTLVKGWVIEMP